MSGHYYNRLLFQLQQAIEEHMIQKEKNNELIRQLENKEVSFKFQVICVIVIIYRRVYLVSRL